MVSSINTLVQRVLTLGLSLSAAACASLPEPSAPMALGAASAAPRGFVEFCERQPGDCGASPAELASLQRQRGASAQTAAIQYDWSGVFAANATAPKPVAAQAMPAVVPSSGTAPVAYDWSKVFAAQLRPAVNVAAVGDPSPAAALVAAPAAEKPALTPKLWALISGTNETINRAIVQKTDLEAYGVDEIWTTPIEAGGKYGDCEDYVLEKRRALLAAGVPKAALSIAVVSTFRGESHAVLLVDTAQGEYVLDNLTPWVLPWAKTAYQWRERQVAGSASSWALAAGGLPPAQPARLLLASAR